MKKGVIVVLFFALGILFIASCATHHQKCPGVYNYNNQTQTVEKPS